MAETTTIQITKDQADQLAEYRRYDNEPYKSVITRAIDALESDNSATTNQQTEFDWAEFDRRLQEHLGEWEITVNMDQLDLDPVGLDENDVKNIVERYLENNWRDLQQGNI